MHRRFAGALVALALMVPGFRTAAAAPEVVAVAACDPYADLKKQIRWVGTLVDQPVLDALVETSTIMPITSFKGLAGLDVNRPIGLVVTAANDAPAVHAYVPVKDLGKLLDALRGVLGPVEEVDGVRRLSPPGGMPLDVVEKDGWAIIGPQGAAAPVADPTELFAGLVTPFTLGVQAFPSRMPDGMRKQLRAALDQAAAMAATQGQAIDRAGIAGMLDGLRETESLIVGVALDSAGERVAVEMQTRMVPESPAAGALADAAKATVTVASPATSDGKPAAVSAHVAMAVPQALRQAAIDGLAAIRAEAGADAGAETAMLVVREALAAMIEAGGYDAALSVDTSVVPRDAANPVPAVTAGMRVKDGAALETRIKKLINGAGEIPGLKVAFDTGKVAGATLHTLTVGGADVAGLGLGDGTLPVTLAVAPNYAWILTGPDVPARLEAVAGGKPAADAKPLAEVNVAVGPLLRYVAALARAADDVAADPAGLEGAADVADAQKSAIVQMLARPVERGMSLRLSADAGSIRTVAASVKRQNGAAAPRVPATGGPDPIPFPLPVR